MRINCPYDVDAIDALLEKHDLRDAHPNLAFDMLIFPNHKSVAEHRDFVAAYLDEEVAAGRMSGPFTKEQTEEIVGGYFQCSPMLVAVQTQEPGKPDKLRLCRHLSKGDAKHPSTNDYIDKDDFPTRFGTAARSSRNHKNEPVLTNIEQVANAPEGTQAMTLDIAKFHRTCPIHPEHKRWFVVQDDRGFFIDHDCPFGCSSSSSNAGRIANAIMDIAAAEGINPSNKYEDDLLFGRTPTASRVDPNGLDPPRYWYGYDENGVRTILGPVRAPWHPDKGQGFAPRAIYIGFLWDFEFRQVSLTEDKRRKFLRRVIDFRQNPVFSLYDIQKIHGSLCHIAYVYPLGRSYLAPLSNAIVDFKGNTNALHHHTTAINAATRWWVKTLSVPNVPRSLKPRGAVVDLRLYVDASTNWGIGTYWDGKWDAFRTKPGWKSKLRHITWLEAVALELMVYTIAAAGLKDVFLRVYSDNQGVIGAFAKGRSPNYEMNLAIRRMGLVLDAANIVLDLVYVPSEENPADKLSRGELGSPEDRSQYLFPVPNELIILLLRTIMSFFLPGGFRGLTNHKKEKDPGDTKPATEARKKGTSEQGREEGEPRTTPASYIPGRLGRFNPPELPPPPRRVPAPPTTSKPVQSLPENSTQTRARKPKKGNEIANNSLRPHVPAKDRIRLWKTPFAIRADAELRASLPEQLVERTYATLHASYAPNSTSSYAAGPLRFNQFCDEFGISEEDRMPASHILLSAFVSHFVGTVSGEAVRNWLSGLKAWHDTSGAEWHGGERWVQLARRTANKMGSGFKREQRGPVTLEHLQALRAALDLDKPFDASVWAAATTAFWGCRRLGEVVVQSADKFDPKFNATRGTQVRRVNLDSDAPGTSIHIPWTKSTRERGGTIILSDRPDDLCPHKAYENHKRVNANVPDEAPLFAYESGRRKWSALTKDAFLRRCAHIWKLADLLAIAGHSFRIGGSTELLLAGVPCDVVAATGGWTSLAFLLYWRRLEHIVIMHVGKAYNKKRLEQVQEEFEQFRIRNGIVLVDVDATMNGTED
ncbi:hypothetical protein MKEN_00495700 [Mycena kentingensis (nom. inval.)]|nr:hypothetical protein MKEN_00495700 [Mycena kentingensis (nom. inval.)]